MFNEELSYCELGSTIIWNEENKTISLRTNISDKCFIYFDAATKEIMYAYKADLSRPYLIEEIISDNVDEILMFFEEYDGNFSLETLTINKNAMASNEYYAINGYNAALYVRNSSATINNGDVTATGYGALGLYGDNSTINLNDMTLTTNNTEVAGIILDDSTLNIDRTDITTNYLLLNGASTFNLNENSTFTGQITVTDGANITINKDGSFVGCINIDNSNAVVDIINNGNMSLTCDSHVTTFVDTNNYSNILSNGYNIYYDQNYNPELNGETIPLNGGGYLLPN